MDEEIERSKKRKTMKWMEIRSQVYKFFSNFIHDSTQASFCSIFLLTDKFFNFTDIKRITNAGKGKFKVNRRVEQAATISSVICRFAEYTFSMGWRGGAAQSGF